MAVLTANMYLLEMLIGVILPMILLVDERYEKPRKQHIYD